MIQVWVSMNKNNALNIYVVNDLIVLSLKQCWIVDNRFMFTTICIDFCIVSSCNINHMVSTLSQG